MKTLVRKLIRALLALIVVVGGLALTRSHASAAPVTFELCALPGTATLTGSSTVPIWGFGVPGTPGDCSTATAGLPGPVLEVHTGDTVTINLTNALPAATPPQHTVALEIPGITFDAGPITADAGSSVVITFTAGAPGTYIYQSGGDAGRQEAMGLYGAFIVRPAAESPQFAAGNCSTNPGTAYGNAFDRECVLVLSQVDPNFNNAPDSSNLYNYLATYWLINGKAYPDTTPILASAGQRVLLRYVNAGYDNTSMMLLGMHEQVLARDAYALNNPFLANTETIPAGGTEDAIATVPASGAGPNGFALYNRQLHDGMTTFIQP